MPVTINGTTGVTSAAITYSGDSTTQTTASIPSGEAKAWVNFNGVTTPTIRASYNVTSVTRNGAGDYTVNFTNALTDANYAKIVTTGWASAGATSISNITTDVSSAGTYTAPSASAFRLVTSPASTFGSAADPGSVYVAVFR